jgi:Protein of unknown function (DUF559)/Transcriptional regulator, AbiEi antitoxin
MRAAGAEVTRVAIARLSVRQQGVFNRAQALDAGMHPDAIYRRVKTGEWEVVDYGVYRLAGTPTSWRQRVMAACLAGPAVASHRSAAALWGFVDCGEDVIEVTALRHRRRHNSDVMWHESQRLDASDVTELDGLPITRPLRTLLDLGLLYGVDRLEELLDDGLRRGWFSAPSARRRWEQLGGDLRPGGRVVRAVLDRKAAGERPVGSILETRFRQLVRRAGLPEPVPQYEIHDGDIFIARVDFAYPELGVVIEVDGEERHTGRSPRNRDVQRDRRLSALGFHPLRFYWDEVHTDPESVARDIAVAIRRSA